MALAPKKLKTELAKIFTDREEPRRCFQNALNETKEDPDNVHLLFFYGEGGLGKSTLLRKIEKALKKESPDDVITDPGNVLCISYDMKDNCEMTAVIDRLEARFRNAGHTLPRVSVAHAQLARLNNEYYPIEKEKLSDNAIISTAFGIADVLNIPGAELARTVVDKVWESRSEIKQFFTGREQFEDTSKTIFNLDEKDLRENYVRYFIEDLNTVNESLRKSGKTLVVLVDTYEQITYASGNREDADQWMKDIVLYVPGVLWCMVGREKLTWEELEGEENIQYPLGYLTEADSGRYLNERVGLTNQKLVRYLYGLTKGLPVYLSLCAESYHDLAEEEQKELNASEDQALFEKYFGTTPKALISLFYERLTEQERNIVDTLAVLGTWDRDAAMELLAAQKRGYARFLHHSFISQDAETGVCFFHQVVRDVLVSAYRKNDLDSYREDVNKFFVYCMEHADASFIGQNTIEDFVRAVEEQTLENGCFDEKYKKLNRLIKEKADSVYERYSWNKRLFNAVSMDSAEYLNVVTDYLWACEYAGYYPEMNTSADYVFKRIPSSDSKEYLSFIMAYAEAFSVMGNYKKALEYNQLCYDKRKEILGEDHPRTLQMLDKLANVYGRLGDYSKALEYSQLCYDKKQKLGEDYPSMYHTLGSLAIAYFRLGNHLKALEYNQLCYDKEKKILGEDHPHTLRTLDNLAATYGMLGDYPKALEYNQLCYDKGKKILGEDHPDTIGMLGNLAIAYGRLGDHPKALGLFQQCYDKKKKILGEDHPDTIRMLGNLALALKNVGDHLKSVEYNQLCYEKKKEILGEDHPNTLLTLGNLANAYGALGDCPKALEYAQLCYDKKKEIFGKNHPATLKSLRSLANAFANVGNQEKAKELQHLYEELKLS